MLQLALAAPLFLASLPNQGNTADWRMPRLEPWGSLIAVPRPPGQIHVLDYELGKVVASFEFAQTIDHIAVQPRGQRVAVVTQSGLFSTLSWGEGPSKELQDFWPDEKTFGHRLTWTRDGSQLLMTGFARTARVFDPLRWEVRTTLALGDEDMIVCGAWSTDGAFLAIGDHQGVIQVFDRKQGPGLRLEVPWGAAKRDQPCYLTCLAFDAGSKRIAAGTSIGRTFVWNLSDGTLARELVVDVALNVFGFLEITTIDFSPDGSRLVETGNDWWQVHEWDLAGGKELWHYENGGGNGRPIRARYSDDGARVLTNLRGQVFEARTGKRLASFHDLESKDLALLELLPDGKSGYLSTCAGIQVYDIATRELRWELSGGKVEPGHRPR